MINISKLKDKINIFAIILCCLLAVVFDFFQITYTKDEIAQRFLAELLPLTFGSIAVILLIKRSGVNVFGKAENLLYLIPCMIIAVDNFPFYSYMQGNMQIIHSRAIDYLLFAAYCLLVGFFEECIFRGLLFGIVAERFSNDKKGFIKTYVVSSVIFGAVHLLNLFSGANVGATILQVGYSTLTGGLFAFAFIKTKNVLFAGLTHSVYNFCGLLFSAEQGLGTGVVFDFPTGLIMAVVSVIVGSFVLYSVWKYSDEERQRLYKALNVHRKEQGE